ncbi:MAG: zinc ribbon domain-containing protein, partial [Planctomycetota bacterium]
WKARREEEVKPSLKHFKPAVEKPPAEPKPPPRRERKRERALPLSSRDRLPPWKREGAGEAKRPSLAAELMPPKPSPPTEKVKKIRKRIVTHAREERRKPRIGGGAIPVAVPAVPVPVEKVTRKVRKAVATQAKGAQLCPKCQWVVKPGQRFCTFCGTPTSPAADRRPPSRAPTVFEPRHRSTGRRPRPPVRTEDGAPPFLKGGCVAAAVGGFVLVLFVFICVSGTSSKTTQTRRVVKPKPVRVARPEPPRARPGIDGPRVLLVLRNGARIEGNLLTKTPEHYKIKSRNRTMKIPRSAVVKVHYR